MKNRCLSSLSGSSNNFNLIRLLAALSVLVCHAYALGGHGKDPLAQFSGFSLGDVAVDLFFALSGYLVASSLFKKNDLIDFCVGRFLRIYPAIWVVVVFLLFVSLIFGSAISVISEYLFFVAKNSTLILGVQHGLPGVFEANPYPRDMNGSLWTMPYEIKMYLSLIFSYVFFVRVLTLRREVLNYAFLCLMLGSLAVSLWIFYKYGGEDAKFRLFSLFYMGVCFFLFRDKILISGWLLLLSLAVFGIAVYFGVGFYFYKIFIFYWVVCLAFADFRPAWDLKSDYSFGIYIYHFPVQQAIVAMDGDIDLITLIFLSAVLTFFCAWISWNYVEKVSMSKRNSIVARLCNNKLISAIRN